ncbi:MAG: MBL fold metallo-hydrolase [Candidatus Sumerlaeia bacterium]|nr:MBL fold metallo-hydrolase [Candidatus Sumerlaeia bacterium]
MRTSAVRFVLCGVLIGLTSMAWAQRSGAPRKDAPLTVVKISANLYELIGGRGANGGLYIGGDGVLLVDSKMDEASVQQVLAEVKKLTDKPIKYLVNTHSDGDHVAGNRYLPEGVTVVAHENCRNEFFRPGRDGSPSQWTDPKLARFVPSITYRDKMTLYLGDKAVELWYFGVGHTTGDTVVYFPEEKTAFLGDQIFLGRTPLIHAYKGGNSLENVKTLSKMLETLADAQYFCSGHASRVGRDEVKACIAAMKARHDKVASLLKDGKGLDEIKKAFAAEEAALVEIIVNEMKGK